LVSREGTNTDNSYKPLLDEILGCGVWSVERSVRHAEAVLEVGNAVAEGWRKPRSLGERCHYDTTDLLHALGDTRLVYFSGKYTRADYVVFGRKSSTLYYWHMVILLSILFDRESFFISDYKYLPKK